MPLALPAQAQQPVSAPVARSVEHQEIGHAVGNQLHVMSFNLRFASTAEPNSWARRRPVMAELLARELPTVLATQEGLYQQVRDVEADLPAQYDWIGVGREGGSRGEFMAVFYDTARLAPLAYDHFWLSDTPDVVGSMSWGNRIPRMATLVSFRDRHTGADFVVVNTHLDSESESARVRGARLIRERIAAFDRDMPVLLAGDFNAPAGDSVTYDILTADLTDTWLTARRRGPVFETWHGYRPLRPDGRRIDWILTRGPVIVRSATINTFARDGQFPSDHLPVQAVVSLG
ncbi:endonuclease/exonuclease/phosphatase family protein [Actinophytocola sediminis]